MLCTCVQGLADVTQKLEAVQQLEPPSKGKAEAVEQGTKDGGQHTTREAGQGGQEGAQQAAKQGAEQGAQADGQQQQEAQREAQQQHQAQLEAQRQQKQQQAEADRQQKQQHEAELEAVQKQQQQLQARREEQLQQQQASSYQIEGVKTAQSQESSAAALSEKALGNGAAGDAQTGEPGAAQDLQSQQQQKSATHYDSIDPMESRRESGATLCASSHQLHQQLLSHLLNALCLVAGRSHD